MRTMSDRFVLFVASGFGIGLFVPFAPGTFGSAAGVALSYATASLPLWLQIVAAAGLVFTAIPICGAAERMLGVVDDGRITADEWMLYPIAVLGLPLSSLPWWSMAVFFAVTRLFDIVKPPPARGLQDLHGGLGIVADDLAANLYSLAANWAIYLALFK